MTLPEKASAKILRDIDLLERHGFSLGLPYIKKLEGYDELWELRTKHSSNIYRVFYFHYNNGVFVLLHGIIKKSDKLKIADINISNKRLTNYKERKMQNES